MNAATRALNPELFSADAEPAAEPVARTNAKNDGRSFQRELETTAQGYSDRMIATFRKVDPPVRIVWPFDAKQGKKVQRVIFMANPYLDFFGCLTTQGGRALLFEAKSTSSHRLPFRRHGGLTEEQVDAVKLWHWAGAATFVLWQWDGNVCLFSPERLIAAESRGDKSLTFEGGLPVPRGQGKVIWDFLPVLFQPGKP